ncbi:hypothetical protein TARUN_7148 [Trichoderma arundinaceum]|uniref:Uncharacterized protein n=1 Tax=Trichoderma arundinaceum TaxID=490622 RepID=A0A395NH18_TRIAR|nr:hypothetical protein TARUN_7148 [Trichoderma arundinaceum]
MKTPTIAILAALEGLQAVVAQQIASTPVWVDATTCNPWAKSNGFPAAAGLFTTALDILNKIVNVNLYRMYNPSKQSPAALPANVLAWERYRLNSTFDAFFGNNTDTKAYALGVWDVAYQLWGIQAQWGPANSDPYIFVVCDDAPYLSKNSNGKLVYTDPYYYATVELDSNAIVNDGVTTPCAMNNQSSYTAANRDNQSLNVILCIKNTNLPLGFTSNGPATFTSGTTLDIAGKSWLGALYTQALWTFGFVGGSPSAHSFTASHAMRNTRDAIFNPDSNKFFAFALMFDGLFWGSGVGQTSQQEYTSLQKTVAGKKIIAAFGLDIFLVPARDITWASGWVPPNMLDNQSRNLEAIPRA